MERNSENSSDANDVHLEGNFLFSLSFFVTRNRNVSEKWNCFFYKWLKAALQFCFTSFSSFFSNLFNNRLLFVTGRSRTIFWKSIKEKLRYCFNHNMRLLFLIATKMLRLKCLSVSQPYRQRLINFFIL